MENLRLLEDPDLSSPFFEFKKFAQQLQSFILDPNTPTPYTIGLHGEWGSGKTSLIYRVYEYVKKKITVKRCGLMHESMKDWILL